MSRFSLNNFEREKELKIPAWVLSGPPVTLKLYHAVQALIIEIEARIKSPVKEKLTITERTLVNRHIAEKAGVSNTNLRKDRQGKLLEYIESENKRLERLWKNSISHASDGRRLSKSELERLKSQYEREIERLEQRNLTEYFNSAYESHALNEQKALVEKYKQLKNDFDQAQETIANLRKQNQQLITQLNTQVK